MVYFSTATTRRSRGGTWSIIAPPVILFLTRLHHVRSDSYHWWNFPLDTKTPVAHTTLVAQAKHDIETVAQPAEKDFEQITVRVPPDWKRDLDVWLAQKRVTLRAATIVGLSLLANQRIPEGIEIPSSRG